MSNLILNKDIGKGMDGWMISCFLCSVEIYRNSAHFVQFCPFIMCKQHVQQEMDA